MKTRDFLWIGMVLVLSGCSSVFVVKSDPLQADVYFVDPKTGAKKPLGKTPLEMKSQDLRAAVGDDISSGEYFTVGVEKPGYATETLTVPATRFGTMATTLDVKLKEGAPAKEEKLAKNIIDHLFLAQKFALSQQYERAQMEIDKILADFPNFARAFSMRASIYFAQKNYADSLKWYDEALKVDPQMEDAVKMSAKVRTLVGGRAPASVPAAGGTK